MQVSDYFLEENIQKGDIECVREFSPYWDKAGGFIVDNWEKDVLDLTSKQRSWTYKIVEDLTEAKILKKLIWKF